MGDEEMALVPDVQYGLSSHGNFDERKSLIFVKLTDSSQRAITEYLKIKHKINEKPNIQFLGNEGHLSIPSVDGVARFTFSMGMESSQGGNFELAQQTDSKSLESLGAIPYRMRIQANDDVYETTRHRMAVAEENNKNKCTRVIKANGPDIGRKVKVKGTGRTIPPPSSYARHRESASIPTSGNSQPKASTNKPIANSSSNSNSNNHPAAARNPEKKISEIMRRPLKERLIHILALRPYKKPELYDRISKEGLRERERPVMTTILKQVAYMRDNTYHLLRHIWNDVQEDWPFYTEQERTMLRRRKPQNLTPPGSSDGSSGSGQSPNSLNAGSPPAITAPPPNLVSNKRPGYFQGSDGLPTKKPRISHYKKPISFIPSSERMSGSSSYSNNNNGVSATAGGDRTVDRPSGVNSGCGSSNSGGGGGSNSNNGGNNSGFDSWESRQQSQRERSSSSRVDYRAERTANSDVSRGTGNVYSDSAAIATVPSGPTRSSYLTPLSPEDNERGNPQNPPNYTDGGIVLACGIAAGEVFDHPERRDRSDRNRGAREERNRERDSRSRSIATDAAIYGDSRSRSIASDAATYGETSNSAPTYVDNANIAAILPPTDGFDRLRGTGHLDCRTEYTTITNPEQKRRYKEEFYNNYDEYRRLHSQVLVTANRFTNLYALWQNQKQLGNVIESEETRERIFREYEETKQNRVYQNMKERFDYLHNKLSHIKRLILEYDSENAACMSVTSDMITTTMNNVGKNTGGIDNRHY